MKVSEGLHLRARAIALAPDLTVTSARLVRDPLWWVLLGAWLLAALGLFHTASKYASAVAAIEGTLQPTLYFDLHAIHQAEFIAIVSLAAYRYRALGGALLLLFTTGASLSYLAAPFFAGYRPPAFLVRDRLVEIGVVLAVGTFVTLLAELRARDREKRERALAEVAAGNERLAALYEAGQALAKSTSLSEAPSATARAVVHHLGQRSAAAVYLYSSDADLFLLGARDGLPVEAVRGLNTLPGPTVRDALGAYVSQPFDLAAFPAGLDPLRRSLQELGFVACLLVPLRVQEEWLGLMIVGFTSAPVPQQDVDLLDGIGRQAALAIRNAQLFESERHQRAVAEGLVRSLRAQMGASGTLRAPAGASE